MTLRAVRYYRQTRALDLYPWEMEQSRLNPAASQANFLLTTPAVAGAGRAGGDGVTPQEAIAQFGRPARTYWYEGVRDPGLAREPFRPPDDRARHVSGVHPRTFT